MLRLRGMILLVWPSSTSTHAETWKLFELSGLVHSDREARIALTNRLLYVNDEVVTNKHITPLNSNIILKIKTGRRVKELPVFLVNRLYRV